MGERERERTKKHENVSIFVLFCFFTFSTEIFQHRLKIDNKNLREKEREGENFEKKYYLS